jgi:uncharacterized repeat protein (TIGR01451 family)
MKKTLSAALALAALALFGATASLAQKAGGPLESQLVARKVVVAEGRESLADAGTVKPGDVIEYVATYRNAGKDAITGLQATIPIPPQTEFIPGTARPARARASLDGRSFADIPLKRTVTRDGKQIEEQVPYREYRALRWFAGELGAGKTADFTARVKVIDDRTPSEPGSKGGGK